MGSQNQTNNSCSRSTRRPSSYTHTHTHYRVPTGRPFYLVGSDRKIDSTSTVRPPTSLLLSSEGRRSSSSNVSRPTWFAFSSSSSFCFQTTIFRFWSSLVPILPILSRFPRRRQFISNQISFSIRVLFIIVYFFCYLKFHLSGVYESGARFDDCARTRWSWSRDCKWNTSCCFF